VIPFVVIPIVMARLVRVTHFFHLKELDRRLKQAMTKWRVREKHARNQWFTATCCKPTARAQFRDGENMQNQRDAGQVQNENIYCEFKPLRAGLWPTHRIPNTCRTAPISAMFFINSLFAQASAMRSGRGSRHG
jgi:hypothetical protein